MPNSYEQWDREQIDTMVRKHSDEIRIIGEEFLGRCKEVWPTEERYEETNQEAKD